MGPDEDREQRLHDAKMERLAREDAEKEKLSESCDRYARLYKESSEKCDTLQAENAKLRAEVEELRLALDNEKAVASARGIIIGNLEGAMASDFAKLEQTNLQNSELRKALAVIVGEAANADEMVGVAERALSGKPKSDGWHCPVCNLIADRVGLPCPDCAEKRNHVVGLCSCKESGIKCDFQYLRGVMTCPMCGCVKQGLV